MRKFLKHIEKESRKIGSAEVKMSLIDQDSKTVHELEMTQDDIFATSTALSPIHSTK